MTETPVGGVPNLGGFQNLPGLRIGWFIGLVLTVCAALPAVGQDVGVAFWYGSRQVFGVHGEPQRWINVLGYAAGAERLTTLTYRLNGGPADTLTVGGDLHRLAEPGDFNVELAWDDVRPGANDLVVNALYRDGRTAQARTTLVVTRGRIWPLPYRVDFSAVDTLQRAVQVVDGHWALTEDGVRTVAPYYDRVLSLGDTTWHDYEARVRLTIHGFTPSEPGPPTYNVSHFGIAMRWRGHHTDGRQPSRKWFPMGAQGELLLKPLPAGSRWRILFGSEAPTVWGERWFPAALGVERWVRAQVRTLPGGDTRYRYKTWPVGTAEPPGWHVEGTEPGALDYPSGSLCIVPHNSAVTIHEVTVEPLSDDP